MFIFLMTGLALSTEYHVDKDKDNVVKFISDAPIEDFEGVTDQIDGYLYWEEDEFTKNSEIYLEVDLNTLDTGIGLRNRHMRENYLETDQYPKTFFRGKIINSTVANDTTIKIEAEGTIFIHGIEKPLKVVANFFKRSDGYRIQTNFIVRLSDFQIEVPSIMFYKINEDMDLRLDFHVRKIRD